MIGILCEVLRIPPQNVVPFEDWVSMVRSVSGFTGEDNPAARVVDFLSEHFVRMSCGGLILDTTRCRAESLALRSAGPVDFKLLGKYVAHWKKTGFLHSVPT